MIKAIIKSILNGQRKRKQEQLSGLLSELLLDAKLACYDIGAANGLLEHWRDIGKAGKFCLFEPDDCAAEKLRIDFRKFDNVKIFQEALAEKSESRTLHITNVPTGSSLLEFDQAMVGSYVDPEYIHPLKSMDIEVKSLERVIKECNLDKPDMLKIDVQGAEFEIIKGLGGSNLSHLLSLEFEYNLHNTYIGQGAFSEIQGYLNQFGLELFDIRTARAFPLVSGKVADAGLFGVFHNSRSVSSRVWELDLVFFRNPNYLIKQQNKSSLMKLIACYAIHGFFVDIYALCVRPEFQELVGIPEAHRLMNWAKRVHAQTSLRWYDVPSFVSKSMRKLASYCGCGPDWYRIQYSHVSLPNS